jgi:hypothetical protein
VISRIFAKIGSFVPKPMDLLILAVPETAGSVLYGMVDVLSATGNIWQNLVRTDPEPVQFRTWVLTLHKKPLEG